MKTRRRSDVPFDTDAELKALRIRRENSVNHHNTALEERRLRTAIADAEKSRNYQIQYGALREAHERLPLGLQGDAANRLRDLTTVLGAMEHQYSGRIPTGPGPRQARVAALQRPVN